MWPFGDSVWCLKACLDLRTTFYLLLAWITLSFPWLDMDCYYFFPWLDMDYYYFIFLPWLDMDYFVFWFFHLFFHELIWITLHFLPWLDMDYLSFIVYLFFHDLIWIVYLLLFIYSLMTWYGLSSSSISFPYVDNMFPIGFLWFLLG